MGACEDSWGWTKRGTETSTGQAFAKNEGKTYKKAKSQRGSDLDWVIRRVKMINLWSDLIFNFSWLDKSLVKIYIS